MILRVIASVFVGAIGGRISGVVWEVIRGLCGNDP